MRKRESLDVALRVVKLLSLIEIYDSSEKDVILFYKHSHKQKWQ